MIKDLLVGIGLIAIFSFIYVMYDKYDDYKISKDKPNPNRFEYKPTLQDYDNIIDDIRKTSLHPSTGKLWERRFEERNRKESIEFIEMLKRNNKYNKEK